MIRQRAKKLREKDVKFIAQLITQWPERAPTWDQVVAKIAEMTGEEYTRQALHRHQTIALAFETRRSRPQDARAPRGSIALQIAEGKIVDLKAQVAFLEAENRQYKERLVRWAYNAYAKMTEAELDEPLPDPQRGRVGNNDGADLRRKKR